MQPTRSNTIPNQITLSDGRKLGFAEFGNKQGKTVFYFHGFPGSRLEAQLAENIATDSRVRLIGIDRPGFGLSDFKPKRSLTDWPIDVTELANTLGIDRFSILGVSGGGPYAAVCAHQIPNRLIAVGIVCGIGPIEDPRHMDQMIWLYRQGLRLARRFPKILAALYPFESFFFRNYPEYMLSITSNKVAAPDRTALKNNALTKILSVSFREAFRGSLLWPVSDVMIYSRPWGFHLADIRIKVHLWHGEMDRILPSAMGHYLANTTPIVRPAFIRTKVIFRSF